MTRRNKIHIQTPNRPDYCTDEMLDYLDELKETGKVNMVGASPNLRAEFPELDKHMSHVVLAHWRDTYGIRHPEAVTTETEAQ